MAHVVTELCDHCKYTDCVEVCPVDCFYEAPERLYIHPDECIDCQACVATCPVQAIFADTDVPEKFKQWIEINRTESPKYPRIEKKKEPLLKEGCVALLKKAA